MQPGTSHTNVTKERLHDCIFLQPLQVNVKSAALQQGAKGFISKAPQTMKGSTSPGTFGLTANSGSITIWSKDLRLIGQDDYDLVPG